jgi:hypothetical protein
MDNLAGTVDVANLPLADGDFACQESLVSRQQLVDIVGVEDVQLLPTLQLFGGVADDLGKGLVDLDKSPLQIHQSNAVGSQLKDLPEMIGALLPGLLYTTTFGFQLLGLGDVFGDPCHPVDLALFVEDGKGAFSQPEEAAIGAAEAKNHIGGLALKLGLKNGGEQPAIVRVNAAHPGLGIGVGLCRGKAPNGFTGGADVNQLFAAER